MFLVLRGLHEIYFLGDKVLHRLQLRGVGYDLVRPVHELGRAGQVEVGTDGPLGLVRREVVGRLLVRHDPLSVFVAAPGGQRDGARAGHCDDALVLDALRVVELLAVDAPLALRDERVDRLMAVHAFVPFRESCAFAKPGIDGMQSQNTK